MNPSRNNVDSKTEVLNNVLDFLKVPISLPLTVNLPSRTTARDTGGSYDEKWTAFRHGPVGSRRIASEAWPGVFWLCNIPELWAGVIVP